MKCWCWLREASWFPGRGGSRSRAWWSARGLSRSSSAACKREVHSDHRSDGVRAATKEKPSSAEPKRNPRPPYLVRVPTTTDDEASSISRGTGWAVTYYFEPQRNAGDADHGLPRLSLRTLFLARISELVQRAEWPRSPCVLASHTTHLKVHSGDAHLVARKADDAYTARIQAARQSIQVITWIGLVA